MLHMIYALLVAAAGLSLALGSAAAGQSQVLQSPASQVSLLELYTSEGCSSCPPADRWLSQLKDDQRLWQELVPVAFHVDYWDYLGWQDRFAAAEFSDRQYQYRAAAGLRTVYTPGFILAGKEWRQWFVRPRLELPETVPHVGRLRLELGAERVTGQFLPVGPPAALGAVELHLALLGFDLVSEVTRGENKGRELRHDFVVLDYRRASLKALTVDGPLQAALPLPHSSAAQSERLALAGWVSAVGDPRPLQAVGGWLR